MRMDLDAYFDALAAVPNTRSARFADVEMVENAKGFAFDGIAAPTAVVADLGDFTEEYERGSFRKFLAATTDNIPFLHEHNPRDLMATTRSGRLVLSEDQRGFRAKADVVKTDLSERVKSLVDSGDIGGMSIGMIVGNTNQKVSSRGGKPHRRIIGFRKILDVCTTFDPAYAATEAQFRSMAMQLADSPESLQRILMGAYPQLQDMGSDLRGTGEDEAPAGDEAVPDGDTAEVGDGGESGVAEQRVRSVAARRRALSLYLIEHGEVQ